MRITVLIILLFLSTSVSAQYIKGGVIAGLNATQVDGDTYIGYHKLGINAGAIAIVPINKKFNASMEILFSQKGSLKKQNPKNPFPNSYKLQIGYVDVPVLINFKFKEEEKISFGTGASFGSLVRFKEYVDGLEKTSYYIETPYESMDINWIANVLYEFIPHLYFNFRYAYSLRYIRVVKINGVVEKQKNNMLSFRLMYVFSKD